MATHVLLVSPRENDVPFGQMVAQKNGFKFMRVAAEEDLQNALLDHPQTITLWDADHLNATNPAHPMSIRAIGQTLLQLTRPERVFAITNEPVQANPALFEVPAFCHHLFRRYEPPADELYSKLIEASITPRPHGLSRFLPPGAKTQKITLTKSGQRKAAVEAINNVLEKSQVNNRLAALAARASDQLIMNALFDAPVNSAGNYTKKFLPRDKEFDLPAKDQIDFEFARTEQLIGISVADNYGALKKEVVLNFLQRDYQQESVKFKSSDPSAGLGLHGIAASGLSILFIASPRVRTEVMLFFPRATSFKDFRNGFRFLSVISE